MIIAFSRFDTRKPFQEGEEFPGYHHIAEIIEGAWNEYGPRPTVAEFFYGENTLWATGWFLWSQILRYRCCLHTHAVARMEIFDYIEGWYNPHRRHSAINYESPMNFERHQSFDNETADVHREVV